MLGTAADYSPYFLPNDFKKVTTVTWRTHWENVLPKKPDAILGRILLIAGGCSFARHSF
ncbi:hypothetical protein FC82_GL002497 [Secundilactobacillus collinoides DSM 20515 = JCM 1123]|uniref:Uncharacterized protein n=1 Tax=Secundilactobacillus collinoides DSM 20515 = JCM 1123 TaxID=1423733 RepID=A0A0R2BHX4_SECCO|nr:hypothetical protein FC82_GL002497 [Secundilactobacillus collinoides DSM 20515 = JCM 1123]